MDSDIEPIPPAATEERGGFRRSTNHPSRSAALNFKQGQALEPVISSPKMNLEVVISSTRIDPSSSAPSRQRRIMTSLSATTSSRTVYPQSIISSLARMGAKESQPEAIEVKEKSFDDSSDRSETEETAMVVSRAQNATIPRRDIVCARSVEEGVKALKDSKCKELDFTHHTKLSDAVVDSLQNKRTDVEEEYATLPKDGAIHLMRREDIRAEHAAINSRLQDLQAPALVVFEALANNKTLRVSIFLL